MTDPASLTTVRIASTPTQAKLFKGILEAEGIRAYIEGGMLVDEFAASRQLMGITGTAVKVRLDDVERARELLADAHVPIDPAELEAQALEAATEDDPEDDAEGAPRGE